MIYHPSDPNEFTARTDNNSIYMNKTQTHTHHIMNARIAEKSVNNHSSECFIDFSCIRIIKKTFFLTTKT